MSAHGQTTLIQHLVDPDALEVIAREGLPEECLPSEQLRRVYSYAIDYWYQNGRTKAPSASVLVTEFGDALSDHEIHLVEPEDSVEWAIDDLKGTHIHKRVVDFQKRFATDMSEAETAERIEVVSDFSNELVALSLDMARAEELVDARFGLDGRVRAYKEREAGLATEGARFGMPILDEYTGGIHPGELAVIAAGPKQGKSFMLDIIALREWQAGRSVALFTLENSVEMTLDRIACLATRTNPHLWQRGACDAEQVAAVEEFRDQMRQAEAPLWVLQPPPGERAPEQMVRQAQVLGVDTLAIDQLTFVEHPDPGRKNRQEVVRDITHTIKAMIASGRDRMPCILAHQINREGVKAAAKQGFHEMVHLAESSEVERTADWVFSMFQSEEYRAVRWLLFQVLASRREDVKDFDVEWALSDGIADVRRENTVRRLGRGM